ncbi:MAG: ComF family protein [Flavobacteriales bacterium]|nr:ComF family protein [Flavobacteriales bacterium]
MSIFLSFFDLFFPDLCKSCENPLNIGEKVICTECRHKLPQTNFHLIKNNPIEKIFYGRAKVQFASSFLFFHKNSLTQSLVHNLKYRGHQEIGKMLGHWYGSILASIEILSSVDFIVAVPLHNKRENKRGYNQVDAFGRALAEELKAEYSKDNLLRITKSETQTKKKRFARWKNVEEIFHIQNIDIFEGKHLLLIDDVITTGATLEACCHELEKSRGVRISIVTMAMTS